mmetsp:Transcript_18695/g.44808  ORF Transcript_18695/g.44808 Transcript_18695/m.44808 type:complete len:378 (+) Transcript_18695:495-1628(+)
MSSTKSGRSRSATCNAMAVSNSMCPWSNFFSLFWLSAINTPIAREPRRRGTARILRVWKPVFASVDLSNRASAYASGMHTVSAELMTYPATPCPSCSVMPCTSVSVQIRCSCSCASSSRNMEDLSQSSPMHTTCITRIAFLRGKPPACSSVEHVSSAFAFECIRTASSCSAFRDRMTERSEESTSTSAWSSAWKLVACPPLNPRLLTSSTTAATLPCAAVDGSISSVALITGTHNRETVPICLASTAMRASDAASSTMTLVAVFTHSIASEGWREQAGIDPSRLRGVSWAVWSSMIWMVACATGTSLVMTWSMRCIICVTSSSRQSCVSSPSTLSKRESPEVMDVTFAVRRSSSICILRRLAASSEVLMVRPQEQLE